MKTFYFIFFCFCLNLPATAQQNILQGNFKKNKYDTLYLRSFYGINMVLLDSCVVNKKGEYAFKDRHYATGFYRLSSKKGYTDCILEENTVTIIDFEENSLKGKTTVRNGMNQQGISELKAHKMIFNKRVDSLFNSEGKDDRTALKKLIDWDDKISQDILLKYKGSFFSTTAALAMREKTDKKILAGYGGDTLLYFKEHFFDMVDFSNPSLARSTLLPNLYMRYLSKYVDYDEKGFKAGIDLMLTKAKASNINYNLTLEYLLDLFEKAGPDIIFEYILENYYLDDACQELEISGQVREKISLYQTLLPDQQAPLFTGCIDKNNQEQSLENIVKNNKGKQILLFFWSTHCHFCQELTRIIKENAASEKIQLVGINIDEKKQDWMDFNFEKESLINLYSPGGWESDAARQYMVNKTPTVYLLDEHLKILNKNLSLEEVKVLLAR